MSGFFSGVLDAPGFCMWGKLPTDPHNPLSFLRVSSEGGTVREVPIDILPDKRMWFLYGIIPRRHLCLRFMEQRFVPSRVLAREVDKDKLPVL
ncbi:MAG: hypothetical protein EXR93_01560 [Gemmatimonadetes bacterium]|nr:hypothetical protein [Gemmatimonadota bacterium]